MPDPLILELEAHLTCPTCRGTPFYLYRRQVKPGSPVYEHVLWGAPGTSVPPPVRSEQILCPDCRCPCVRTAP
ncbi:MAG: hypothetical protein Q8S13_11415 [Dehalococcoidia bacterium]|nr:hypothetical protein [Dehalococcoidia bacterium]